MNAHLPRRALLAALLAPLAAFGFPDEAVEWVVPYPAGGATNVKLD